MSIGNFPESLSQAILEGRILVGRLGVPVMVHYKYAASAKETGRTSYGTLQMHS